MSDIERLRRASRIEQDDIFGSLPPALKNLFIKPALLQHEDVDTYQQLARELVKEIAPTNTIEWILLRDVIDRSWDVLRLRRLIRAMIDAGRKSAIGQLFGTVQYLDIRCQEASQLADRWANPETREEVENELAERGIDAEAIAATSFSMQTPQLEAAHRMLAAAELCRNNMLDEIESRRERFGHTARAASNKVIEHEATTSSIERNTQQ